MTGRLLLAVLVSLLALPAGAQNDVKLKVTINSITSFDQMDGPDGASFYAKVIFDGALYSNIRKTAHWYGYDSLSPNWEFVRQVNRNGTVNIVVEIWDEDDGFWRGADDLMDVNVRPGTGVGRSLQLTVNVQDCLAESPGSVSGSVSGACGVTLQSSGAEAGFRGRVSLTVAAEAPPIASGLRVRCTHDPIWPQPSDPVTITAEALNDVPVGKSSLTVPEIEVWINDRSGPARVCANAATCSEQRGPFAAGTFSYGCMVRDGEREAWSGWRTVQVGNASRTRAVPVLFTGPRPSRIDIVFIPGRRLCSQNSCINFTSAQDPRFLSGVRDVIRDAYFDMDIHLRNQDAINFWLAQDHGHFEESCKLNPPMNWDEDDYIFADVGVIVHENQLRDCANYGRRVFSSEFAEPSVFLHETGHRPFGLADEYCCDGDYFQTAEYPNVYSNAGECRRDVPGLRLLNPNIQVSDCRQIADPTTTPPQLTGWWVSDPSGNDLMEGSGDLVPRAADLRRIEWIYGMCKESSCQDLQ